MKTVRLTMAQALARFLTRQMTEIEGRKVPLFAGMWAIFGHGNVAGFGEALYGVRNELPTYRAHNEQAMVHTAVAYAKAMRRRRMMACTTSIGPGALNMVTGAAVAHVDRLPVLLLPGDVFANRKPDPVLQQVEDFGDGTVSANDCFRPVSRYFDRITRPEQLVAAMNRAMTVLTDPAECGPVTICLCQDVQAEAFDYPESFFAETLWVPRRVRPDENELSRTVGLLREAKKPVIIAGGGVLYSEASAALAAFAERHGVPVVETQAGKSSLPSSHPLNMGAVGVTGTSASNRLCEEADVVLAVGTRLQDFTTGSWALFKNPGKKIIGLNVQSFDATKHRALPFIADARVGLEEISANLGAYKAPDAWTSTAKAAFKEWIKAADAVTAPTNAVPSDAQVIGAVQRALGREISMICASGGLPGELHKLWQASYPSSYHLEYGFSCMGYEIAGGIGLKMADPSREVIVMVGDGSYLMLNSEIATSVMLGTKLVIVVLDNRGFGCISRLQKATGGARFNNLFEDAKHEIIPEIDFAAHARSLGAVADKASSVSDLERLLKKAGQNDRTTVVVIDTDPMISTEAGGHWWDVAVPEVSERAEVEAARRKYESDLAMQHVGD
ncbi:MAG: 3D-(3,5/4)-trihydroxycyclohexane-1,2-dione acylhydrolase (decyclizing) [Hyphomicrobiales bacterium]